jgi:hypothetical protein
VGAAPASGACSAGEGDVAAYQYEALRNPGLLFTLCSSATTNLGSHFAWPLCINESLGTHSLWKTKLSL